MMALLLLTALLFAVPAHGQTIAQVWAECQTHFTVSPGASKGNPARIHYDTPQNAQRCEALKKQMDMLDDQKRRAAYRRTQP